MQEFSLSFKGSKVDVTFAYSTPGSVVTLYISANKFQITQF